jgi:hypothetical protein
LINDSDATDGKCYGGYIVLDDIDLEPIDPMEFIDRLYRNILERGREKNNEREAES